MLARSPLVLRLARNAAILGGLLGVVYLASGCGDSSSTQVTQPGQACIHGVVRLNGQPVVGATVGVTNGSLVTTDNTGSYCVAVTANATYLIGAGYTSGGTTYTATATVTAGAAASCGGSCATQDLALVATGGGGGGGGGGGASRYTVTAYIQRSTAADSGTAYVTVHDDSLNVVVATAVVTLQPDGGAPVTLTGLGGAYLATGIHSGVAAYLPIAFAGGFTLKVDLNGDGKTVATGHQFMPGSPTITSPADGSGNVSNTFDMTWTFAPSSPDSTFSYATVTPDSAGTYSTYYKYGYNITSGHFASVPTGAYVGNVMCWRGPWAASPLTGYVVTPNITGGRMSGLFWTSTLAAVTHFHVGMAAPAQPFARR